MNRCIVAGLLVLGVVVGPSMACGQRSKDQPQRNRRETNEKALHVAEEAPNFVLKSVDGESWTDLSSFKDKKPVVLIFGSYT